MANLNIVSLNVRGLRGNKRFSVFTYLKSNKFDICLLQETYCTKSFISKFSAGWSGEVFHSVSDSVHSRGVCILVRKGLKCFEISSHSDNNGRIALVNLNIDNCDYTICNVYCPNEFKERCMFLEYVKHFIGKYAISTQNLIVGGDVNCVLSKNDRVSKSVDKSTDKLKELIANFELCDIWRYNHPHDVAYTFIDPSGRNKDSRIDLILINEQLTAHVKSSEITHAPVPDHRAVCMCITLKSKQRGKGYWKLNNSVLDDQEYVIGIVDLIYDLEKQYSSVTCHALFWEYLKRKIKEYSISYCTKKAKDWHILQTELESKLRYLDEQIAKNIKIDKNIIARNEIKQKLDDFYITKSKGYHIRSRAKWVEEGEKSTRYFLKLEKDRQINNSINYLKDENGIKQYSDEKILQIANSFFSNLYSSNSSPNENLDAYFNEIDKISNENKNSISLTNLYNILQRTINDDRNQLININDYYMTYDIDI